MLVKDIIDNDTINSKKISMFIIFPKCTFKCDKECGKQVCQNSTLALSPNIEIETSNIIKRYLDNPVSESIVCGGLEPFDSWEDLYTLVKAFRDHTDDFIIIYTGYYPIEIQSQIKTLKHFKNIIIKFGRFMPNQKHHYDKILGVELASTHQYAERIS